MLAIVALLMLACQSEPAASPRGGVGAVAEVQEPPLDFGDDWDGIGITWMPESDAAETTPGSAPPPQPSAEPAGPRWVLVLGTYTGDGAQESAEMAHARLPMIDPRLGRARVHRTGHGAMIIYGNYEGPREPDALNDKAWLKSLRANGQPIFPRVMASRVTLRDAVQSPHALIGARTQYPNIDPLYTLEVGMWGVFDSDLPLERVQEQADAQVRQLRAQGHPAFVHHDPDREMSMVTVGLFDHRAINPQSGLLSLEVEELMQKFPTYLVNGEPILEPIDPRRPNRGTRTKGPILVEVPQL